MRFKSIAEKAARVKIVCLESFSNYTRIDFADGLWALSSYTKKILKIKLQNTGICLNLTEVRRGKDVDLQFFEVKKLRDGRTIVEANLPKNSLADRSVFFYVSRRKLAAVSLFFLLCSMSVLAQITAVPDTFTGCKSSFNTEWLEPLVNDTDSRNQIEIDSAVFFYPVYKTSYIDAIRNVSAGSVQIDTANRRRLRVRWTNGQTLVDSLAFEYRVVDTVGTDVYSNWALVILTGKVSAVATAGNYTNTSKTVIHGCRMLNRGRTTFQSGSNYELRVTNGATFGPGTEFKAGSVVEIVVDD